METSSVWLVLAAMAAFGGGALAARELRETYAPRVICVLARVGVRPREIVRGRGLRAAGLGLLAAGVRSAVPAADVLMRFSWFGMLSEECSFYAAEQGVYAQKRACGSVLVACAALMLAVLALVLGSFASAAAVLSGAVALAVAVVRGRREKRNEQLRRCMPDVVQALRSYFQAGLSLEQAFDQLAQAKPAQLGQAFGSCAQEMRMGVSASNALARVQERVPVEGLSFVTVALDIQHQTGGSLSQVLLAAENEMLEQFELERQLSAKTAQARLSARVVTAMPFVLLALFSLMTDGFLNPFFESAAGICLLAVALALQVAGVVSIRRMLRVKGVAS